MRPEMAKALTMARQFKEAVPEAPVIFTVHELKRLAQTAAELMTLSAELQARGIQLELLTGSLNGIYDPHGMGAMFFAVLAVARQIERNLHPGQDPGGPGHRRGQRASTADGRRSSTTTCWPSPSL
ncbi:recombinase family protein [Streptomyces sp. NPDC020800]|uniref:recombinase family protein n=1 Tax=Streptomyces sp. NPDC020800 TaxID=3365092 RepID=UPI0037B2C92D